MSTRPRAASFVAWLRRHVGTAIVSAVIGGLVAWFANVWLMAVRYNGYEKVPPGGPATGNGNLLAGMAFWGLATTMVFTIVGYRRQVGGERFWAELRAFPTQVRTLFTHEGRDGSIQLLWGAAVSLLMTGVLGPSLGALLGVGLLATAPTMIGQVLRSLSGQAVGSVVRAVAPNATRKGTNDGAMTVAFLGAGVSLLLATQLSSTTTRVVLGAVCAAAAIGISKMATPPSAGSLLLAIAVALIAADLFEPVAAYANDGGTNECGNIPLREWLERCQGSKTILVKAGPGAAAGAAGGPVGSFVGGSIGATLPGSTGGGSTGGGATGGTASGGTDTRPPRDGTTPDFVQKSPTFDPSVEEQTTKWKEDGLVWDPGELAWRPPRPGEIPPPSDLPENTPFQQQQPRDQVPPSCLSLYDRYVRAQADVLDAGPAIERLSEKYRKAQDHLNKQLAKLTLKTGWDLGSMLGGGVDGVHGVSKGIRSGAGTGLGEIDTWAPPGKLGAAVAALRERLAAVLSRVKVLTDAVAAAGEAAARARTTVANLAEEARGIVSKIDELTGLSNAARRTADELSEQLSKLTRYDGLVAQRETLYEQMLPISQRIKNLEGAHQRLIGLDDWAKGQMANFQRNSPYLRAVQELPAVRAELGAIEAELAQLVKRSPKQLEFDQLTANLQRVNRQLAELGDGASNPKLYQELLEQRRELDYQRMKIGHPPAPEISNPNRYSELINRKRDLQLRKATLDADLNTTTIPRNWEDAAAQADQARYQAWKLEVEGTNPRQAMQAELDPLREQHRGLASQIDALENEMGELKPQLPAGKTTAQVQQETAAASEEAAKHAEEAANLQPKVSQLDGQKADAEAALRAAESEGAAKELELSAAKQEASNLETELARATEGAGQGPPAATGWGNPFKQGLQKVGEGWVYLFGADQSGEEIAKILNQCRQSVIDALNELNAAQAAYDRGREELRTVKGELDACMESKRVYP